MLRMAVLQLTCSSPRSLTFEHHHCLPSLRHNPQATVDLQKLRKVLMHQTSLTQGLLWHFYIVHYAGRHNDIFISNILISMYSRCSSLQDAAAVFDGMDQPNVVSWNSVLAAYCKHGNATQAINFFQEMRLATIPPDRVTFMSLLGACATQKALAEGKYVHLCIIESGLQADFHVQNSLVNMYGKCGALKHAISVFEKMEKRSAVSWTIMIDAYTQNGEAEEASDAYLSNGRMLHASLIGSGLSSDAIAGNALVNMYGKCGALNDACLAFRSMHARGLAAWNPMIRTLCKLENFKEAFELFHAMQHEGIKPDNITLTCLLRGCLSPADLKEGRAIHAYIVENGFETDLCTQSALVNMFGKYGALKQAQKVFDQMPEHDVVAWTGMIAAYSQHGYGQDALQLFEQMEQEGIKPNEVTFLCLLSACVHAGLVKEAWQNFHKMTEKYGICPALEHYTCIVDILGRAGWLVEARKLISEMPFEADAQIWVTLLGACCMHGDMAQIESVANEVFAIDATNLSAYILLSNTFAAAERWEDAKNLDQVMIARGLNLPATD